MQKDVLYSAPLHVRLRQRLAIIVLRSGREDLWKHGLMAILVLLAACKAPQKLNIIADKYICDDAERGIYCCRLDKDPPIDYNPKLFRRGEHLYYDKDFEILPDSIFKIYFALGNFNEPTIRSANDMVKTHYLPHQYLNGGTLQILHLRLSDGMHWDRLCKQLQDSCNLTELKMVRQRCDTLTYIPPKILKIKTLKKLGISWNYVFEDFPIQEIKGLKDLEELELLSKTPDEVVFKKVIKYLPKLKRVVLRDGSYNRQKDNKWLKISTFTYTKDKHNCISIKE